ncbi:DsbA family protein, partial [Candidatus Uhrbacteria bacterium]|nr:DsbA family protein [Candidatus Uhrbacteria bacterium]
ADFTCPACADVQGVLTELRAEYGDRLRIVWKDLPHLDRITGSRSLHLAARCAQAQGKFWEFHDAVFAQATHEDGALDALIRTAELNPRAFAACTERSTGADRIDANIADAERSGVTATPVFFVNGALLTDAPSRSAFRALLGNP